MTQSATVNSAYGDSDGYAQIVVGHFESGKLRIDQTAFYVWPDEREHLHEFIEGNKSHDVYYCTSLLNDRKRSVDTATVTNVVYVDADACEPANFRVEPSIVVETSPNTYQCYWILYEPVLATDSARVAQRMCRAHKDQGCDPSGWTVAKLMRVPGTTHGKTDTEYEVRETVNGTVYTLAEIENEYLDVHVDPVVRVDSTNLPEDLPELQKVIERFDSGLFDLFAHDPSESDDWSKLRWRLSLDMLRAGFSKVETFVAVKATKFNKYDRDNRPDSDLWKEIEKAFATFVSEQGTSVGVEDTDGEVNQAYKNVSFLSEDERGMITPTFIDDFAAWVSTRSPLASQKYARFVGFFVLANVFGGWATIQPQMGPMKLNLWGLMLGPSSELKKTTVVNLGRSLLRTWEARLPDSQQGFDIGSDFTPEGLNATLAERDGKVSFIHRDEISGFFNEAFNKNYMAGAVERMTALYEGEVLRTMRATTGSSQKKTASTTLNFLGLGIERHTAQVLSSTQFQSGFLPRFIWCVDDAPDWTPDREKIGQGVKERLKMSEDPAVISFCRAFSRARKDWDYGGNPDDVSILLSDSALSRLNQFALDSKYAIIGSDIEELIEPSRVRMVWVVWKAAALIAMYERSKKIELNHLLYVLRESEEWFSDLIRMARQVAASEFESKVNDVFKYMSGFKNKVHGAQVYRKFSSFRKGEIDEMLATLRAQGRIVYTDKGYEVKE